MTDYVIADTEYWGETNNRLLLKTTYDYNSKTDIQNFPKNLGDWKSFDYKYPDYVYTKLNADILMSRGYTQDRKNVIWMDIINSKTGESFHRQRICVEGSGWKVDNESIIKFNIEEKSNSFAQLYANRLDISKDDKRQIMVYWFIFKKFGFDNSVAMIRLSTPVKNNDTEKTFDFLENFVANQLFSTMYKNVENEEITTAEYVVNKYKDKGKIAIMFSILIPLGFIFTGIWKNRKIQ